MPRLNISISNNLVASQAHKGLVLDRFLAPKSGERESNIDPLKQLALIPSSSAHYRLAFNRWRRASQSLPHSLRIYATLPGRMALGLGIESVHEIGCRLHHTYGVPVIPGSSLKGCLRSRLALAPNHPEFAKYDPVLQYLFGTSDGSGALEVFDAWWVPPSSPTDSGLSVDVLTPHHQDYNGKKPYGKGDIASPSDSDSPIPVNFLTITGSFYFVIGFSRVPEDQVEGWKVFVRTLMDDVLQKRGLGAKQRAGYGRFLQSIEPPPAN